MDKNYLRITVIQQRLTELSILSVKHKLADNVDINDIVAELAKEGKKMYSNLNVLFCLYFYGFFLMINIDCVHHGIQILF